MAVLISQKCTPAAAGTDSDAGPASSSSRLDEFASTANPDQASMDTTMRSTPVWHDDVWNLLHTEGRPDQDDDAPVIYVKSYFLDHIRLQHHDQCRPLRFSTVTQDWEPGIRWHTIGLGRPYRPQPFI